MPQTIARQIDLILKQCYPGAKCTLDFTNPLELLIATILAAQCTDERVNKVTPALFKKYPSATAYASAPQEQIEQDVRQTGFFRNKAKAIRACCAILDEKDAGAVPKSMDELTALPGVGRKTANVILGNAYGIPGIVVDTHVKRLAQRMGFTTQEDPEKIEFDLQKLIPQKDWTDFSHRMVSHGRAICQARKPKCPECAVNHLCPYPKRM